MDSNKSKMKNIKAKIELEPDFPWVATPQSSEWIIYIISYAYNPFTAPWRGKYNNNKQDMLLLYLRWKKVQWNSIIIIISIIILSCLTSSDNSKPIQKRISVNDEGLSTPITIKS